ncbi:eEF1A lysine and N-terminal methyltransferase-like [Diadema setosum]|uniref:eEF1A lysine and N-terminal methyltransferase-like n=1 Tax=Diadema setosum TaxID=31175 RepID=UPI003B3BCAD1
MDLLPKSAAEFSSAQYWDTFFKKRGSKAFEWYGDYTQLCGILHTYVRPSDRVLVIGCGNSRLGEELYDAGFHQLVSIDIIDGVIKQMARRNGKKRPEMQFEKMDVTQMTYEDASYSVVLDKGTLDGLMTDDGPETVARIDKMFGEVARVLKLGGRYVCITLAQNHVLSKLLQYFPSEGWMLRIQKVDQSQREDDSDQGSPLPVFVVICTKLKKMGAVHTPILEVSMSEGRTPSRVTSKDEVRQMVKDFQDYAIVQDRLHKESLCGQPMSMDLWAPDSKYPRYTMHIVDRPKGKTLEKKFAVFIVPQGRETEFLFVSDKGRGQLAEQAGFQRLVVVTLHRGHTYQSIDTIKAELSSKVMELAPGGMSKKLQVPFLSIGNDVGHREVKYQSAGSLNDEIIVEDVKGEDGDLYRQLVFSSNLNLVQSQAKLVTEKVRSASGKKRGKTKTRVDHWHLSMAFHRLMVAGFALIPDCVELLRSGAKAVLVGLGGGALPMFLYKHFPQLELDVVELDPALKDIAKSWFGLVEDERLRVHIQDGLEFIKNQAEKDSPPVYNVVMFDVDSKDTTQGISCPPRAFLESSVLEQVKRILHPKQGIFILNFACRDDELKETLLSDIRTHFPTVQTSPMEDDVNEIVYGLLDTSAVNTPEMRKRQAESAQALQEYAKSVSPQWDPSFDLCEIMDNLKIAEDDR